MNCRHCSQPLEYCCLDLGVAPPSNAYVSAAGLNAAERHFPLRLLICQHCWLLQTEDCADASELFASDYAYFSSTSSTWLEHAARYARDVSSRFAISPSSFVIEIASNDGYLLKNFVDAGIPCLGIEPTESTAAVAASRGVPVLREFFGLDVATRLAQSGRRADLIVANNVYAHVPEINDFTAALKVLLEPGGLVTLEFAHVLPLVRQGLFDTVYHEHYSYLSLAVVNRMFDRAGLKVFDVERLTTHGGSLRVYGCHAEDQRAIEDSVAGVLADERAAGLQTLAPYRLLQSTADRIKNDFVYYLIEQKRAGKRVIAYGAAAKGNTLLNYGGVKRDLVPWVCDAAPSKQGKWLPGSRIPVVSPDFLREYKPDVVVILPWNIADEVIEKNRVVYDWGGRFVTAVPRLEEFSHAHGPK